MSNELLALCIGFLLDIGFGDPLGKLHPVCLIGKLIESCEKSLRRICKRTRTGELWAGILLAGVVSLICFLLPFYFLRMLSRISPWLALVVHGLLAWQLIAMKSLKKESMAVFHALKSGSLADARRAISSIVGRDTESLDCAGVIRAAVETVAENTSDGVIAPLLYIAVGGAPLGFLYKAVNTMDSMVGYQNERYLYFGRAAAKFDDALNFIPARVSAVLMLAAAWILRFDYQNARRIFLRDRHNHASPNSAQTESVCAGALGLQLAGYAYYFGELHRKPTIGDALRPIEAEDIVRANRLMYAASALCFALCVIARAAIYAAMR